jgi:hypothetical protein
MSGKTPSKPGPCPQLQVGEIGIRGYLMMIVKTGNWDSLRIAQCLELSLVETPKNESLLIAACHFWSNGVNAFLFGHGPMSPPLANVYMMTGLDITGSMYPYKYKGSTRKRGVKTGVGYKVYIHNHMSDGPLTEIQYKAFLNMWLCRFVFCGKANEPTLTILQWLKIWLLVISFPLERIF